MNLLQGLKDLSPDIAHVPWSSHKQTTAIRRLLFEALPVGAKSKVCYFPIALSTQLFVCTGIMDDITLNLEVMIPSHKPGPAVNSGLKCSSL
jgi:hypothetical protein